MRNVVKVYHRDCDAFDQDYFIHVATVQCPVENTADALEYAYRWTQNVHGSWSKKVGEDSNDAVLVEEPLKVIKGTVFGHRSSMVQDRFQVSTEPDNTYECKFFGFERLEDK